jgi:succinyl-CoA synthetase beta subunit
MKLLNADKRVRAILVNIFGSVLIILFPLSLPNLFLPSVSSFSGIMRCDVIALGLIKAATTLGLKKPIVIRLAGLLCLLLFSFVSILPFLPSPILVLLLFADSGTNVKEAIKLIDESGLRMVTADDLGEAAQKAVRMTDILKMAEQAHLDISFNLPI